MTISRITLLPKHKPIVLWLLSCCALVFIMVIVGAITRLTESGLSIAEWKPLIGALPPLNETEWHRIFDLYKQTPEFQKKNFWMDLPAFKNIFFWEWAHRFLGRLIGLAYGLPLVYFWLRKKIPHGYKLKLLIPFLLGGAQGALGWYMVSSGLVDIPAVSHYRLAAHLSLAFLIIAVMLWLALSIGGAPRAPDRKIFLHTLAVLAAVIAAILWGAFTAGLDGGLIYNDSFPKMGGAWIPPEAYQSLINNPAGVQFMHRWLAIFAAIMGLSLWAHAVRKEKAFSTLHALGFMMIVQPALGLATLLSGVNLPLAVLHQAGALTVLMLLTAILHRVRPA